MTSRPSSPGRACGRGTLTSQRSLSPMLGEMLGDRPRAGAAGSTRSAAALALAERAWRLRAETSRALQPRPMLESKAGSMLALRGRHGRELGRLRGGSGRAGAVAERRGGDDAQVAAFRDSTLLQ